jgi:hypothetical protein
MRDYLEFDCTPCDENCVQTGITEDYLRMNRIECRAMINQLMRMFPDKPEGVSIKRKINYHDFGTYYSIAIYYHDDNEQECEYAYNIEENFPANWDDEAKQELKNSGYKL